MKFICRAYRFGTYNQDGSLDYGLNLIHDDVIEKDIDIFDTLKDIETRIFETTVKNEHLSMNEVCNKLYDVIPDDVNIKLTNWYSDICTSGFDVISTSFDKWIFFKYTRKGCWPSFAYKRRFSFGNQMEFAEKTRYFALWDNVTGWFDPRDEDVLHLHPSYFRKQRI